MRLAADLASASVGALVLLLLAVGCSPEGASNAAVDSAAPAPSRRAAQRVQVAEVRKGRLEHTSVVTGITEAFRQATVSAEISGRVVERHVEPGQPVAKDDPLVSLDATHLGIAVDEAAANRAAREVDLAEAVRELARGDELSSKGAISDGKHDALRFGRDRAQSARDLAAAALRRAREQQADAVVRAPFSGTVESVEVQVGNFASPGAPVAAVVDFARVRILAGVTASEAAELSAGGAATVSIPALGGFETAGTVHSIGLRADDATGTYPVELWLDNAAHQIRGGMVADIRLPAPEGQALLLAPRGAILRRDGRLSVYVIEESGGVARARLRTVRVGREQGHEIELREGVDAGESVVVEGHFALSDGAEVQVDRTGRAGEETAWND